MGGRHRRPVVRPALPPTGPASGEPIAGRLRRSIMRPAVPLVVPPILIGCGWQAQEVACSTSCPQLSPQLANLGWQAQGVSGATTCPARLCSRAPRLAGSLAGPRNRSCDQLLSHQLAHLSGEPAAGRSKRSVVRPAVPAVVPPSGKPMAVRPRKTVVRPHAFPQLLQAASLGWQPHCWHAQEVHGVTN